MSQEPQKFEVLLYILSPPQHASELIQFPPPDCISGPSTIQRGVILSRCGKMPLGSCRQLCTRDAMLKYLLRASFSAELKARHTFENGLAPRTMSPTPAKKKQRVIMYCCCSEYFVSQCHNISLSRHHNIPNIIFFPVAQYHKILNT